MWPCVLILQLIVRDRLMGAGDILKRCDGTRDIDALIPDLQQAFNAQDIGSEVRSFVAAAERHGCAGGGYMTDIASPLRLLADLTYQ